MAQNFRFETFEIMNDNLVVKKINFNKIKKLFTEYCQVDKDFQLFAIQT